MKPSGSLRNSDKMNEGSTVNEEASLFNKVSRHFHFNFQ